MGAPTERFQRGDVFIDYAFERVMFRWERATRQSFRKFYGEAKEDGIPHNNNLFNEAIRFGDEIDAVTYAAGKPKD